MNKEEAIKRIEELSSVLNRYNYLYYVQDVSEITDYQFDTLLKELENLEKEYNYITDDSPTRKVGGQVLKEFAQVKHDYPMFSLSNTYSFAEIKDFDNRVRKSVGSDFDYTCELKYDGSAISLQYENGKLKKAVTRGNGTVGDDVTSNIITIPSVPLKLHGCGFPEKFEIRGEVFMKFSTFNRLNDERAEIGDAPFANPRNAASGSLKLLDSSEVAKRSLSCFLYAFAADTIPADTHYELLNLAKSWGINTSKYIARCKNVEEIFDFINEWDKARFDIDIPIDGVVIKVNQYALQEELGYTAKFPRWAVAYKFKAEQAESHLNSIVFQVGRTGIITPVANFDTVTLAGTNVKRATLHNEDVINSLDLRIGDTVIVEKGGEIIPKIVGVNMKLRSSDAIQFSFIEKCPECGATLKRNEGEAAWYCPNEFGCPPQIKGKIEHFISKKAMNIEGLGEGRIDLLYEKGLVKKLEDLYFLKIEDLIGIQKEFVDEIDGKVRIVSIQEKGAANIIAGIEKSKQIPFEKVLFALGIKHVGETVAAKIVQDVESIEKLMTISPLELIGINDIGEKIAYSIYAWFSNSENKRTVEILKTVGLKFIVDKAEKFSNNLNGNIFVVSGSFKSIGTREDVENLIAMHGGKTTKSVSAKTSFLLAGENIGNTKLVTATKLGVKIISEDEFMAMIK